MFRVGLTGGIASGKSTAAKFFGALGVPILDSDQVARDVVEPGQPPLERLVERFGPRHPDARRAPRPARAARHRVRGPQARADLEALTHPAIGAALEARSAVAGGPYQILVIPLLVEKSLGAHVDRVLVVDCDEELQIRRLQARDGSTPRAGAGHPGCAGLARRAPQGRARRDQERCRHERRARRRSRRCTRATSSSPGRHAAEPGRGAAGRGTRPVYARRARQAQ